MGKGGGGGGRGREKGREGGIGVDEMQTEKKHGIVWRHCDHIHPKTINVGRDGEAKNLLTAF